MHFNRWLEARFERPPAALPGLRHEKDTEAAAAALRQLWGVGQQPVKNFMHPLESKGVRVFSLWIDAIEVDAFSTWKDGIPFVFLNTWESAEHGDSTLRMSSAISFSIVTVRRMVAKPSEKPTPSLLHS